MDAAKQPETLFRRWLTPLVNLPVTLLLFTSFIFHHVYFGKAHPIAALLAVDRALPLAIYVYGGLVLLLSLIHLADDWRPFAAFMGLIGSALISIAYTAVAWLHMTRISWLDLVLQTYYVFQAVLSLLQVFLLLSQAEGQRWAVTPRLGARPLWGAAVLILAYVVGLTLWMDRVLARVPEAITMQVNALGVLLLQGGLFLRQDAED